MNCGTETRRNPQVDMWITGPSDLFDPYRYVKHETGIKLLQKMAASKKKVIFDRTF